MLGTQDDDAFQLLVLSGAQAGDSDSVIRESQDIGSLGSSGQ